MKRLQPFVAKNPAGSWEEWVCYHNNNHYYYLASNNKCFMLKEHASLLPRIYYATHPFTTFQKCQLQPPQISIIITTLMLAD